MADISEIILPNGARYALKDSTARDGKVSKSGDTMSGKLTLKANQYTDAYNSGALDLQNSNIDGVNSIYTADTSDNAQEGIHFYRDGSHVDSLHAKSGVLYFTPNRQLGNAGTPQRIYHVGSSVYEADLAWGGKNFVASYGPIDAAMISVLGANRLEIPKADGITVEYSRDGGTTWIDYGLTDGQKQGVFSSLGTGLYLGKYTSADFGNVTTDWKLRVTLICPASGVYTVLNKFAICVATQGAGGCYVTIDACTKGNESTFVTFADQVSVSGWSGWNIINTSGITTCGSVSNTSQYSKIRFTFGITSTGSHSKDPAYPTYHGAMWVSRILGFGGVGWATPSNLANNGHLYRYDVSQNAIFPAKVTATEFVGSLATVKNNTSNGHLGWTSTTADKIPITSNTLAYWDGRYDATRSNLAYCSKGALGSAAVANLSTSTSSTSTTTAATSSAVKTAYDLANSANTTAGQALSGVNGNLIYDHTFTISNGVATFTPHVYQKGVEVTTNYAKSCFSWKYRLINGTEVSLTTKNDRGCDVTISSMGYGGHVIGIFTPPS